MKNKSGFTLVELLIVMAIVSILATATVIILNPAEIVRKSQDSRRISDLTNLNKALGLAQVQGGIYFGDTSKVYVSLPDDDPGCVGYNLPTLPAGKSYVCKPSSEYRKSDGNGWLPVPLNQIQSGSPLPTLPVDPKQQN